METVETPLDPPLMFPQVSFDAGPRNLYAVGPFSSKRPTTYLGKLVLEIKKPCLNGGGGGGAVAPPPPPETGTICQFSL